MNEYTGHLKHSVNSQKVYYAPRVGAGISAEKYDLMGGIQGLRTATKAGNVAKFISKVFPGNTAADQAETTCAFVTGLHPPYNPIFSCSPRTPYRLLCWLHFTKLTPPCHCKYIPSGNYALAK